MMDAKAYDIGKVDIAWCPGCGNFSILRILKDALSELGIKPEELVMVSGIGQAAKIPHYFKCNVFNGLHGRALPPAAAIKAVNKKLVVIAESGDGDMYGEGGNHLLHTIRRNPDITNIVHNNMVYGLTKGQASPTSFKGFKTPVQVNGVILEPFNPLAVAVGLGASFVSRAYSDDLEETKEIIKKAIKHKGYALVDLLHPCVTYNKLNDRKWFKENTYYLDGDYNPADRNEAFKKAIQTDKLPLGIFYVKEEEKPFEEKLIAYKKNEKPMYEREVDFDKLKNLIESKRG
jgi:2-oxoglutarate ferredoxin oxidoreductase subunit beta